jgi:iron complex outermembrane recepter protein
MKPYRINEASGDTVSWDLIPDIAIDRFDIISANPVYGRNALGGAAVITMKNGVTYQGFENELAGGSFGPRSEQFQYGLRVGMGRLSRRTLVRFRRLASILAQPAAADLRR